SSTAFSENMRLTGDGKLGIGTNAPTERLSVSGNGNFSGGLTVGGALGVGLGIAVGGGIAVAGGGGVGGAMGVGTTTPAPSAQLDVSSTTKGLLMPRMTSAQRDAIQSPAEGLTVYNTETHSPWYRTNNEWKEIKEDLDTAAEQLVFRNGPEVIYTALNNEFLGVGVDTPSTKLQVKTPDATWGISHTNGTVLLSTFVSNAKGGEIGTATNHPLQLFANGGVDQFVLTPQGNVGIGTAASHAPLQFANTDANRKIVLKESQNDNHHFVGIGSNSNSLRYQIPDVNASHLFYAGTTNNIDSSKLLMNITGSGDVGIEVANPLNQLDIHQGTIARSGSHPVNLPLYVTGNIGDAANGVEFRYYDGTQGIGFGKNTIYAAGSSANQNLGLSAKGTTGAIRLVTNGLERLYVTGAGNIGIGTISPNAPLQFGSSVANRKVVLFETANNDHQYFGFGINGLALRYQVDGPGSSHVFYAGSSSSTSTELFRITGTGNVGIGVPSPLASLVVARGTGNNGTAEFKGTTNSSHFNYSTNEDTYIRGGKAGSNVLINDLAGEGNVGVGTSVPLQKLHVEGNSFIAGNEGVGIINPQNKVDIQTGSARTGVHPTGLPLYVTGDISNESNGIEFRHSNGSQGVGIGFNTIYATGNNSDQDLGLASRGLGSLIFKTQQTERMRINENGNVGIGTSAPNAPLQFPNDIRNRKVVLYDSYNNDHQFYGFGINGYTLRYQVSSTSDSHIFYAGTSPTTSTELMRISGNGNVGIGTSTPSAKLDVAGNVNVAGEVNVGYYITTNSANVQPLTTTTVYCNCAAGYKVMGGGWNGPGLDVIQSSPDPTGIGWISTANNLDPILAHQLTAYAICARIGQ
ncbi:MAG TPA: hypothetical protein VJ508_10505, partial [Saprospiraceae bacterium]|nr:hypothetical protein [Saprospiraceae bacterium]